MLMGMKQNTIKFYTLLLVFTIFILGCTNQILYHPPKIEKKLLDAFYYETKSIHTEDNETLFAVEYYTPKKDNKGVILFLHGNADNIYTINSIALVFLSFGYDLLLLDYRGYGKSTGSPSPKGLNLDIKATINYLNKEFDNIYIYAQSIGGTSILGALDDINQTKIRAIATEGAFLSYKQLSEKIGISVPFANYEELKLYSPISTNRDTNISLMIIHSVDDEIVPYSQGVALSKHFKNSKHIKTSGRHLGYFDFISNYRAVSDFFDINRSIKTNNSKIRIKEKGIK